MDKKETFITIVDELFRKTDMPVFCGDDYENVMSFWEAFKAGKSVGGITENGGKILQYMQSNADTYNNLFKAKEIGEGLFMSSRSVSGAMRKLITDGYVTKTGTNPVIYSLTEEGKAVSC